jgi:hypothetical protein
MDKNGNVIESHNYKNGQPIGKWFQYGPNGNIVSSGLGVEMRKYEPVISNLQLEFSVLSLVNVGEFN